MFNIYTGCLYDKRIVESRDFYKIAVCTRLYPSYSDLHWYKQLAPSDKLFKAFEQLGWSEYLAYYNEELEEKRLNGTLNHFVSRIAEINQYLDVALLCYERPSQTCHRHTLSRFLNKYYDMSIVEF